MNYYPVFLVQSIRTDRQKVAHMSPSCKMHGGSKREICCRERGLYGCWLWKRIVCFFFEGAAGLRKMIMRCHLFGDDELFGWSLRLRQLKSICHLVTSVTESDLSKTGLIGRLHVRLTKQEAWAQGPITSWVSWLTQGPVIDQFYAIKKGPDT